MSQPDQPSAGSICIGCGLCCDGTLMDNAAVAPGEETGVAQAGLDLVVDGKAVVFLQPCPKFAGGICTVYERRPGVCRSFRCRLLKDVDEGIVDQAQARSWIVMAKDLVARILAVSADANTPLRRKALRQSLKEATTRSQNDREESTKAMLDLGALEFLLDSHFRRRSSTSAYKPFG
jgi:hypothetical protein